MLDLNARESLDLNSVKKESFIGEETGLLRNRKGFAASISENKIDIRRSIQHEKETKRENSQNSDTSFERAFNLADE